MIKTLKLKTRIAIPVILLIIGQALASIYLLPTVLWSSLYINGREIKVARGATLKEIIATERIDLSPGDLMDVDGRVIEPGGGRPGKILLNGKRVSANTRPSEKDSVYYAKGSDRSEGTSQEYKVFQGPLKTSGWRDQKVTPDDSGRYMRVTTMGALSGKVISELDTTLPLIFGRKELRIKQKAIALCFDDGPDPTYTPQVISVLVQKKAPAIFFVLGRAAQKYPKILKMEADSGFDIGNHTFSHTPINEMAPRELEDEIVRTQAAITGATGIKPMWFRPPKLMYNSEAIKILEELGYGVVLGSIDPSDYLMPPVADIVDTALEQAKTGSIIVLHDGGGDRSRTVQALPILIDRLRQEGYELVTVEGLFAD